MLLQLCFWYKLNGIYQNTTGHASKLCSPAAETDVDWTKDAMFWMSDIISSGLNTMHMHTCMYTYKGIYIYTHYYLYIYIMIFIWRGHKYDTGSCCRIRPFFCPPRVFAAGHKPELQKFKQQGGEIYAESTGRNKGNEMQSEAEGKKSYHHPPPCPSKSMLFFANWRLAGIQI